MGIFARLLGSPAKPAVTTGIQPRPQKTVKDNRETPQSLPGLESLNVVGPLAPWAKNLVAYANRVANELREARIPYWPKYDFWVIAADVEEATWHVPVRGKFALQAGWMREGLCSGRSLLLLSNGRLVAASFHGHFNFDEPCLSFKYESSLVDNWASYAWGANNIASWRNKGRSFPRLPEAKYQEFWDGRWNHAQYESKPPGLGTSLALKRFLETGRTQLPKYY